MKYLFSMLLFCAALTLSAESKFLKVSEFKYDFDKKSGSPAAGAGGDFSVSASAACPLYSNRMSAISSEVAGRGYR